MKIMKNKKFIGIATIILIPLLLITQYYLFKFGVLRPMIKGVEIQIVDGEYINDIDKYIIKLNDTLDLSLGDYIRIPTYSKTPNLYFKVLDDNQIVSISNDNDVFKLTALKEGYTSIGIMNESNLLKKVAIKVVSPKVENLEVELEENLVYVGDKSKIIANVQTDYKDFSKPDIEYTSSDESVMYIEDNIVHAVGVGTATIHIQSGDMIESKTFNIRAKISSINISKKIEIEEGQVIKLDPEVITSPRGLKYPKLEYNFVGTKIPVSRAIALDNNVVTGIREGEEEIKISCGNKIEIITIKVNKKSIQDKYIENLTIIEEMTDENMVLTLSWNHLQGVKDYKIYLRNNSLDEKEFNEVKNIHINEDDEYESKKVQTTITLSIKDLKELDIDIYLIGISDNQQTKPSNMINRKYTIEIEDNQSINNLVGYFDDSTNSIRISWDPINIEGVTYSVYKKDLLNEESEFTIHNQDITSNEVIINTVETQVEMEVFITASFDGKVITSKTIIIK